MNHLKSLLFFMATAIFMIPSMGLAQVQINITYHPLSDIRLITDFRCLQDKKDLLVSYELETFVTHPSFLRFEILEPKRPEAYHLTYNDEIQKVLTFETPFFLKQVKRGAQLHHFVLRVKNRPPSYCDNLQNSLLLSLEPI